MVKELQQTNDIIKSINKDIDNMHKANRIFVINNEETYESAMFLRTHDLPLAWINNFCVEYGLSYDSNNEQILIMQTIIRGKS